MRRCLITCAALLAGCGPEVVTRPVAVAPAIPAAVLAPCPGWTGPTPRTEGDLIDAALAERRGRECANARLRAVNDMLNAAAPQ